MIPTTLYTHKLKIHLKGPESGFNLDDSIHPRKDALSQAIKVLTADRSPPPAYNSQPRNVITFGETEAGKSSAVNLIVGDKLAKTSPDAGACTFTSTPHRVVFQITGHSQAYKLIKELERSGGVHLLLLSMRGRIKKSAQQNCRLYVEVLCERKVPLCVVVTHLENEPRMEEWWAANEEAF
ncbi:hypothetical protein HD554DRAFT_2179930 [Boletus coccyginus]|nr:hypothetical protein HD554DRAFT_2179930 [Boletus coccyginus]